MTPPTTTGHAAGKLSPKGKVRVTMYQVGFGDCFLLTIPYKDRPRNVLFDFGTIEKPNWAGDDWMMDIAEDIQSKCKAGLDAVIVSHRHQDHNSGFRTKKNGGGTGDVIRELKPKLVVQSWTEDPKAAPKARGPPAAAGPGAFLRGLDDGQAFVSAVLKRLSGRWPSDRATRDLVGGLGLMGASNQTSSAVENLRKMGEDAPDHGGVKPDFLFYGAKSKLAQVLPGVKVTVLGPPTFDMANSDLHANPKNDEYWMIYAAAAKVLANDANAPGEFKDWPSMDPSQIPNHANWLIKKMDQISLEQMNAIVGLLDDQVNNTSLILLFEVGGKKLLFPGDAQMEDWKYSLDKPATKALLQDVDFYKVGHHGSRNATPRKLWSWFAKKDLPKGRLRAMMSTLPGRWDNTAEHSEVPRLTLLAELKQHAEFMATHLPNNYTKGQLSNYMEL